MSALSLSSVLSCLAWAGDSSRSLPEQKWGGHIELEVKKGNERALQETELFIPLQQDSRSLLFLNARGVFDDQHSKEGNVGLGYRAMLETPFLGQDWIAGIYGFADLRRSPNDNNFMQATVGAELLSEDYDLRLNAYIPHAKEQEISGTNNVTGTLAGTQLRLVGAANQRERALPGFDAEVGVKLPLLADYVSSMRAYGGGFYFDADGYDRVAGPRGRFEVSWDDFVSFGEGSRFTLGTEIQHDDVRGRTAFASARLRIPLQSFKKSQTVKRALSPLERRMTERVVRDVDIVSNVRTGDPVNEPATITINGQQISNVTVLDANDNLAVDIPAAGAGSTVLLDGSAGTITVGATISPAANQNVVGADVELTGADTGFTGVIGTRPALTAPGLVLFRATQPGVTLQNIDMTNVDYGISNNAGGAANFTARNLNISNAATAGILHFFTGGATYENISILDSSNGIALLNVPNSTFTNITLGGTGMVSPLWDLGGSSGNVYRNITVLNATNH
ncbi:MAG: inverse autotransporter beta domain-containing protein, partial [Alphaproteobacteria bacterium]|nr:inverse autotransporter beta domain-containing protein [Alphaproteobacteria bacterium]